MKIENSLSNVSACETHILEGLPITLIEAFFLYGVTNLPAVINNLDKKKGYPCKTSSEVLTTSMDRLNNSETGALFIPKTGSTLDTNKTTIKIPVYTRSQKRELLKERNQIDISTGLLIEKALDNGESISKIEAFIRFGARNLPEAVRNYSKKSLLTVIEERKITLEVVMRKLQHYGDYKLATTLEKSSKKYYALEYFQSR